VELNIPDFEGKTPLALASENGGFNTVELLLQQQVVELNPVDRVGRTPLGLAAMNGHTKVVRRLLEVRDVKPAVRDGDGLTPLALAKRVWYLDTVNAIREHLYKRYAERSPTS
jgi:ankyrin repeat protein